MAKKNRAAEDFFVNGTSTGRLTKELADKIVERVRSTTYIETAAAIYGVNETQLARWLSRGHAAWDRIPPEVVEALGPSEDPLVLVDSEERVYAYFTRLIMKASAEREEELIGMVSDKGIKDWRAASFILERGYARRWGAQARAELTREQSDSLGSMLTPDIEERVRRIATRLAEAADEEPERKIEVVQCED